ncbi:MAG: hypothetical protein AAFX03_04015 [Pseudomonadota bacterium]
MTYYEKDQKDAEPRTEDMFRDVADHSVGGRLGIRSATHPQEQQDGEDVLADKHEPGSGQWER